MAANQGLTHKHKPRANGGDRLLPTSRLPKVIPPRSLVILWSFDPKQSPDWNIDLGRVFRIGYYNREDGLDCIWLVNERGEYEQTTDRAALLKHFMILKLSDERDFFGDTKKPLQPIRTARKAAYPAAMVLA